MKLRDSKIQLLAHRGVMNLAPENTLMAFKLAQLFGFDGVELDVHLSSDRELVIIHDETTKRTTLDNFRIENSTLGQLKKLDAGKFWPFNLPKQEILTLREFFDEFIKSFEVINIELKTDVLEYRGIEKLLALEIACLSKEDQQKIVVSSFNFQSLKLFHELAPHIKVAFLFYKIKALRGVPKQEIEEICSFLNPYFFLYNRFKQEIDSFKKPYYFWTINSRRSLSRAKKIQGTVGLICNQRFKEN